MRLYVKEGGIPVHHRCTKISVIAKDGEGRQRSCRIGFPSGNNGEGLSRISGEPLGLNSEAEGHWFESSSARQSTCSEEGSFSSAISGPRPAFWAGGSLAPASPVQLPGRPGACRIVSGYIDLHRGAAAQRRLATSS